MLSNWLKQISSQDKIVYASVFILSMSFFTSLPINLGHILALAVAFGVIYYLYDTKSNDSSQFNTETEYKLLNLSDQKNYEFMYYDPNLINLLFSIKNDLGKSNPKAYENSLKYTDNFLKLMVDFDQVDQLNNSFETFELAEEQGKKGLNSLHSLIFNIPTTSVSLRKHDHLIKRYQLLIKRNLDKIVSKVKSHRLSDYTTQKAYNKVTGSGINISNIETQFNYY